jgi:DNA-binding MarR family transcriptional regulator
MATATREHHERDAYLLAGLVSSRLSGELDAICRTFGISESQYAVLWVVCLSSDKRGVVQGDISDGLITRAADVSRIVSRLEESSLIVRSRDDGDGRVVRVKPTSSGRAVFDRVTRDIKRLHRRQFRSLDESEIRVLIRLLNRILWSEGD